MKHIFWYELIWTLFKDESYAVPEHPEVTQVWDLSFVAQQVPRHVCIRMTKPKILLQKAAEDDCDDVDFEDSEADLVSLLEN